MRWFSSPREAIFTEAEGRGDYFFRGELNHRIYRGKSKIIVLLHEFRETGVGGTHMSHWNTEGTSLRYRQRRDIRNTSSRWYNENYPRYCTVVRSYSIHHMLVCIVVMSPQGWAISPLRKSPSLVLALARCCIYLGSDDVIRGCYHVILFCPTAV